MVFMILSFKYESLKSLSVSSFVKVMSHVTEQRPNQKSDKENFKLSVMFKLH